MPKFRITAPDGTVYNVTGPDGATEQDALAQVQQQHAAAPGAHSPMESLILGEPIEKTETSQSLGFKQGVGNFLANAAEPGIWAGRKLGFNMDRFDKGADLLRNPEHAANVKPGGIARFATDVAMSAPLGLARTLPGVVAGNAVSGALTSDEGDQASGAALGGIGGGVLHGAGQVIAPKISDAVKRLAANGVQMTPGQIMGGWVKGLEDRAAGFWPLDGWINSAKRQSMRTGFNGGPAGGVNSALAPLKAVGGPVSVGPGIVPQGHNFPSIPNFATEVPPGVYGQDAVRFAGDELDNAYNTVLPRTQTALGPNFWNGTTANVAQGLRELPPERAAQVQSTLAGVFGRLGNIGNPQNTHTLIDGETMKGMDTKLGQLYRSFAGSPDPDQRAMAQIYRGVQNDLRGAVTASNPDLAPQLEAINQGWRNLVPVETAAAKASGNASGLEAGVATPSQYRAAIKQNDTSIRDRRTARGEMPGQQYAEDAINVLPSSIGSSGTSERLGMLALPALAATMVAHPLAAASAAAIPALYSGPGLRLFNAAYAHGAGPGATTLADIFRNTGRFGAGPAAAGALRSDQ